MPFLTLYRRIRSPLCSSSHSTVPTTYVLKWPKYRPIARINLVENDICQLEIGGAQDLKCRLNIWHHVGKMETRVLTNSVVRYPQSHALLSVPAGLHVPQSANYRDVVLPLTYM